MATLTYSHRSRFDVSAQELFTWHERPGAFMRLTPPWEPVELLNQQGGIEDGARVTIRTRVGPLPATMVVEHCDYQSGRQFKDVQISGPFTRWAHVHRVEADGESASYLDDSMEFALPGGALGNLVGRGMAMNRLQRMFLFRHLLTQQDLAAHQRFAARPRMQVLVSGASGLVGSNLVPFLTTGGHRVTRMVRDKANLGDGQIGWNSSRGAFTGEPQSTWDAVVHLAGEGIANRRWTAAQKARIRESRVQGTLQLCRALAELRKPPAVLVCASAIGFYGNCGDEPLDESCEPGKGFLADVCREWESATRPAQDAGIRVVHLRFGVILSAAGGALAKMLLPFRLGVGGQLGNGRQWMSWIDVQDAVGAIHHALQVDTMHGPVNAVAPHPVTNREFTKTLGRVLGRPTVLPMPSAAARLMFGEMAEELLLSSTRVQPRQLLMHEYKFRQPHLEGCLRMQLGRIVPALACG